MIMGTSDITIPIMNGYQDKLKRTNEKTNFIENSFVNKNDASTATSTNIILFSGCTDNVSRLL